MQQTNHKITTLGLILAGGLVLTGCGVTDDEQSDTNGGNHSSEKNEIVVTTSVLADIVRNIVGDEADVVQLMPAGADPHSFSLSAAQTSTLEQAQLVIAHGANLESGLEKNLASVRASDVPFFEAMSAISPLELSDHFSNSHSDSEDDDGDDHNHGHDHGDIDPHFYPDPIRMKQVTEAMSDEIITSVHGIDQSAIKHNTEQFLTELDALNDEMVLAFQSIPKDKKLLVTNHSVLNYFADRYKFQILGVILPGGSSLASSSASGLESLRSEMASHQLSTVFVEAGQPTKVADALVETLGGSSKGYSLATLYTESLGDAESPASTYIDMMRFNTKIIVDALGNGR